MLPVNNLRDKWKNVSKILFGHHFRPYRVFLKSPKNLLSNYILKSTPASGKSDFFFFIFSYLSKRDFWIFPIWFKQVSADSDISLKLISCHLIILKKNLKNALIPFFLIILSFFHSLIHLFIQESDEGNCCEQENLCLVKWIENI